VDNDDLQARMRVLLDKQEIYDLLMRYCRGVDRRDGDLIASCYHPDSVDDRRVSVSGPEIADGIARSDPARMPMSMHFIGNVSIDVQGDTAYSEAYCVAYLTLPSKDGIVDLGAGVTTSEPAAAKHYYRALGLRYLDRLERRDGEWKIAHRICIDDWHRLEPVPDPELGSPHGRRGERSTSDISYAFLAGGAIPAATTP
jgi:hypothetical protein